jgi:hypothetical protein
MSRYPDNLIADCIAYYKVLDGRDLTPDEAERYLDSLADWWDWQVAQTGNSPPSRSGGGERANARRPRPP